MPEIEGHDQLLQYLWEVGPSMSGGSCLSHSEIQSWQANTGRSLNGWESQMLRNLSIEYLGQAEASKAITCPSPYLASPHMDRKQIAAKVQSMFSALISQSKKKGGKDESGKP